jgi:glycosyl transferase, family 25
LHAYVINLARSPERRVHVAAELQRAGIAYEFVDGVEGTDLDLADPGVIDPSMLDTSWFLPGIAGCAFSHLRVYEKILADNLDWALVLEDDVTLPNDLARLAEAAAGYMKGAEVVLLNFVSPSGLCKMSRHGSIRLPSARQLVLPLNVKEPLGSSAAYIITRDACKRMVVSIVPFRAHPDDWGHFFNIGALDRVRCVMPMTVHQHSSFASTIAYHDQNGLKARVLAVVQRYNISFLNQLIAYRRRRFVRKLSRFEIVNEPFVAKPSRLG